MAKEIENLAGLTRKPLTLIEIYQALDALKVGPDSTAAILAATLVDTLLEQAILARLVDLNTDQIREFSRSNMPTLDAKIVLGRALGLFDSAVKHDLNIIRLIRNAFAHGSPNLSFDFGEIATACGVFNLLEARQLFDETEHHTPRQMFSFVVRVVALLLSRHSRNPVRPPTTSNSMYEIKLEVFSTTADVVDQRDQRPHR